VCHNQIESVDCDLSLTESGNSITLSFSVALIDSMQQ